MTTDMTGYIASLLVLLTFMARDARLMRAIAIVSNLAFISYAALAGLSPVLCLHVLLLGVNIVRLNELQRTFRRAGASPVPLMPALRTGG
jgi:hypothetical protein